VEGGKQMKICVSLDSTSYTTIYQFKTVSVDEAVALMKQRKKDPSLRIKGGLDDETASLKNAKKEEAKKEEHVEQMLPLIDAEMHSSKEATLATPINVSSFVKPVKSKKVTTLDILNAISMVDSKVHSVINEVTSLHKKIIYNETGSSVKNTDSSVSTLNEFKSNSHKVTFILNGMEFTVKCLNQVKDTEAHTIVFVFSDDNDSFFTPPMQSELEIKYDGVPEPGKVYYFGMCFSLKALGLKFLGFLYDENSAQ
jgi:hypothetical protein